MELEHQPSSSSLSSTESHKHRLRIFIIIASILVIVSTLIGLFSLSFQGKSAPNSHISNRQIGGKNVDEVRTIVENLRDSISLDLTFNNQTVSANVTDLGIDINIDATVEQAVAPITIDNFLSFFDPFSDKKIQMLATYDLSKFQDFLNTSFPDSYLAPTNASVVYGSNSYEVSPSSPGRHIDAYSLSSLLEDLVANPRDHSIPVTTSGLPPSINNYHAETAKHYMNQNLLNLRINFQTPNGNTVYFPDPSEFSDWLVLSIDQNISEVQIDFNKAKIESFISDKVAPKVEIPVINRKILVNQSGQELSTMQAGQKGRKLHDPSSLVDSVYQSLIQHQNTDIKVVLSEEIGFTTTTVKTAVNNWVDVNLSNQTTTLYSGDTPIRTFIISSGLPGTPTVTGTFYVWHKNTQQTMSGGSREAGTYYSIPNVHWNTYFYRDYAFHEAYWHNDFGQPRSHGCVNMRAEDAKTLYYFAPIGTKVVVHY